MPQHKLPIIMAFNVQENAVFMGVLPVVCEALYTDFIVPCLS